MTPHEITISNQRVRIEELEEELRQAKEASNPLEIFPSEWRLSPAQQRLLSALYHAPGGFLHHDRVFDAVKSWAHYPDNPRSVSGVHVCKMRKKLAPFEISILTRWGSGFDLPPASKAIIKSILEQRMAA